MFSKIMNLDPNKRSQYRMHEKDLFWLFPAGLSFFILKLYFTFWDVLSLFALDDILVNTKWKQWKIHFRLKYLFPSKNNVTRSYCQQTASSDILVRFQVDFTVITTYCLILYFSAVLSLFTLTYKLSKELCLTLLTLFVNSFNSLFNNFCLTIFSWFFLKNNCWHKINKNYLFSFFLHFRVFFILKYKKTKKNLFAFK